MSKLVKPNDLITRIKDLERRLALLERTERNEAAGPFFEEGEIIFDDPGPPGGPGAGTGP